MRSETIGRPMEILLVEDNLADAYLSMKALKDGNVKHRLTLIRDGMEAMEFLTQQGKFARAPRPDLILLDLGLPKVDGRSVLTEVKNDYRLKAIPVVILTASKGHEDILRSELLRVDGFITKPVDLEKFTALVKSRRRLFAAVVHS